VKDLYADSLAYVDFQISRLFEHLRQKGKWDHTLIVLTGDHGQAFYEHGFSAHASQLFNEVMKIPLIIRAPGLEPGLNNIPAQHIDVPPSILALLGAPSHPSFQGINLFDVHPNRHRSIYLVAQTPLAYQYGIIRSNWKLIRDAQKKIYLLFDLLSDPGETKNVASEQAGHLTRLAKLLNTWRKLQLQYYTDKNLHSREYPPILSEEVPSAN
jgi:arylsulfatase A-like enzyme